MSYTTYGTRHVMNRTSNRNATVGFTNPKTILDRMRLLDSRARAHDSDVRLYTSGPENVPYQTTWTGWYADWRKYYDGTMAKYDSYIDSAGLLVGTDAWFARQAQYEQDFMNLQTRYQQLKDANGNALPSNAPPLVLPPSAPNGEKEDGIPLWPFLALVGGIGLCVGGYYFWKNLKAKRDAMEKVLPLLLAPELGPLADPLAKVATARDAIPTGVAFAQAARDCGCSRDLDIRPGTPRLGAKYILSGF